ncbi:hypothetical protein D9M69_550720 [compost metagenome]
MRLAPRSEACVKSARMNRLSGASQPLRSAPVRLQADRSQVSSVARTKRAPSSGISRRPHCTSVASSKSMVRRLLVPTKQVVCRVAPRKTMPVSPGVWAQAQASSRAALKSSRSAMHEISPTLWSTALRKLQSCRRVCSRKVT